MKQWLDFIPLFLFFATYKTLGIFPATAVLIGSTLLVYGAIWLKDRHLENRQKIILAITLLLGGLTLGLHNEAYLKWKAPVVYWTFATTCFGSMYIGEQPLIQRMMDSVFDMPSNVWRKLNIAWGIFFIVVGAANAYVAFHFPKYWVDFKVFGSLGMTLIFMIGQTVILSRYIKQEEVK